LLQTYFRDHPGEFRKLGIPDIVRPGETLHIIVSVGEHGTDIFVNSSLALHRDGSVDLQRLTGPWVLGNSAEPDFGWRGTMMGFAIYVGPARRAEKNIAQPNQPENEQPIAAYDLTRSASEVVYSSVPGSEPLRVAHDFVVLHRRLLDWRFTPDRSGVLDIFVNLVGFVPFGVTGVLFLQKKGWVAAIAKVTLVGFLISLAIEVAQSFMPVRDSSAIDLVLNSVGTLLGAVIVATLYQTPPAAPIGESGNAYC